MNLQKIRVGVDVDEVLRDFVGRIQELVFEETGVYFERPDTYYFDTVGKSGISFRKKIWETGEWAKPVFEGAAVIDGAKETWKEMLANPAIEPYIVTTQSAGTEEFTLNWLAKHGFTGYKEIYITKNKLEAPCQVLIDDKVDNFEAYQNNGRDGYLCSRPHNQHHKTHKRVKDFKDFYKRLKETYDI